METFLTACECADAVASYLLRSQLTDDEFTRQIGYISRMLRGAKNRHPGHDDCARSFACRHGRIDDAVRAFDSEQDIDSNRYDPNGVRFSLLSAGKATHWAFVPDEQRHINVFLLGPWQRLLFPVEVERVFHSRRVTLDLMRNDDSPRLHPLAILWPFAINDDLASYFSAYPSMARHRRLVQSMARAFMDAPASVVPDDLRPFATIDELCESAAIGGDEVVRDISLCTWILCRMPFPADVVEEVGRLLREAQRLNMDFHLLLTVSMHRWIRMDVTKMTPHLHMWLTMIRASDARCRVSSSGCLHYDHTGKCRANALSHDALLSTLRKCARSG